MNDTKNIYYKPKRPEETWNLNTVGAGAQSSSNTTPSSPLHDPAQFFSSFFFFPYDYMYQLQQDRKEL